VHIFNRKFGSLAYSNKFLRKKIAGRQPQPNAVMRLRVRNQRGQWWLPG
jgi:hypothetical protein